MARAALAGTLAAVAGTVLSVSVDSVASAAPGDPFPAGSGLVFVAQGTAPGTPTTLYEAVQGAGAITFAAQGTASVGYNAIGFHLSDMYLYGINNNNGLIRIGQGGVTTAFGQVGLPGSSFNYNQGTFGEGDTADILFVRLATSDRNLYAVNVVTRTTTHITLSAAVPNLSDMVFADGFLWGIYGEGGRLYRIDPSTGAVISVPVTGLPADPYGAQWVYGNGNLGISNNRTGTVYQLRLNNPTTSAPSVTIISTTKGPANSQNDGAAYPGLPADLSIVKSGPATWNPNATLTYTLTVHNLGPGNSSGYIVRDTLPAQLTNVATTTPGCTLGTVGASQVVECAGAALAAGADGPVITITDTAPATAGTDCVSGGIANTASVLGNEADPVLTNNTSTNTACPAGQPVPSFTVSKVTSPAVAFVGPGDRVTYSVTVTNTGTVAYTAANPASFVDNLANVLDDAVLDPTSLGVGSTLGTSFNGATLSWSGPLAVGASVTITYAVVVSDPDLGDHLLTNAVVPGSTGVCTAPGDCDVATPVADFTVAKTASVTQAAPGDTITYALTITNIGQVNFGGTAAPLAPPATLTDSLAGILPFASYNNDASGGGTLSGGTLSWAVNLPIGTSTTLTYSVTVNQVVAGPAVLSNAVTPGQFGSCATPADCTTDTPISGYTVAKTVSATTAVHGDQITYSVVVTNTGAVDYTDLVPATFTDDLSDVLDDATFDTGSAGVTLNGTMLSWAGAVPVGQSVTVRYTVTVNTPVSGDLHLHNTVVPGRSDGTCPGACSTDTTITAQPGFVVSKAVSSTTAGPGDRLTYSVTVVNSGEVAFTAGSPATFTDNLAGVLDDATYNNDATGGASFNGGILSWSVALGIGQSMTFTYTVTVKNPDTGNGHLANAVAPGQFGSCVIAADCTTDTPISGYTVAKTVSATTAVHGDQIRYTVVVANTGAVDYTALAPATFTDDLSDVLDDATFDSGSPGVTINGSTLSWAGAVAVGQSVTVTYTVTVNTPVSGDLHLHNAVVPTRPDGSCAAPCATDTTITPEPGFDVTKTVSATTASPGDKVTYSVTVVNSGEVAFTAGSPATFTDNLADVLDDAAYNNDATGGATFNGGILSWAVALPIGQSMTVTYSVTINNPDTGNGHLTNAVSTTGPSGHCSVVPAAAIAPRTSSSAVLAALGDCGPTTTTTDVVNPTPPGPTPPPGPQPAPPLPVTGTDLRTPGTLALICVALGVLLVAITRRRQI